MPIRPSEAIKSKYLKFPETSYPMLFYNLEFLEGHLQSILKFHILFLYN